MSSLSSVDLPCVVSCYAFSASSCFAIVRLRFLSFCFAFLLWRLAVGGLLNTWVLVSMTTSIFLWPQRYIMAFVLKVRRWPRSAFSAFDRSLLCWFISIELIRCHCNNSSWKVLFTNCRWNYSCGSGQLCADDRSVRENVHLSPVRSMWKMNSAVCAPGLFLRSQY